MSPTNRSALTRWTPTDLVPDGWAEDAFLPWLDRQTSMQQMQGAAATLAGLEAAARTLNADSLELTKARRYLEIRWGELLGPGEAARPQPGKASSASDTLSRQQRLQFRRLAAHRDQLLTIIAQGTEAERLSRNALLRSLARRSTESPSSPAGPPNVEQHFLQSIRPQAWALLRTAATERRLGGNHFRVLIVLLSELDRPYFVPVKQPWLAHCTGLHDSTVSRVLNRLVRLGYFQRDLGGRSERHHGGTGILRYRLALEDLDAPANGERAASPDPAVGSS